MSQNLQKLAFSNEHVQTLSIDRTKISVSCVYKQYEVKMETVQEQRLQLKMKFLLGYMKVVIYFGG